jgi:hypothetical protein
MKKDEWKLLRYGLLTALIMGLVLGLILVRDINFPKVGAEAILAAIAGAVFLLYRYIERRKNPKPGEMVVLIEVPRGMLDDLPPEDQKAINEIVGKPILLNEYDEDGRAELEFKDRDGDFHYIFVAPEFIKAAERNG